MSDLDLLTQSLARNVKRWRTERGFTLDALAARAGVSRGMLIQIEQARTNPSLGTVVKIGDALGISITTLLDYEQGPKVRIIPPEQVVRLWHTDAGSYSPVSYTHHGGDRPRHGGRADADRRGRGVPRPGRLERHVRGQRPARVRQSG